MPTRIRFECPAHVPPRDAEVVLNDLGVRTWGRRWTKKPPIECSLLVRDGQAKWAASLIKGAGFALLDERWANAKPVTPQHRWGKGQKRWTPQTMVVEGLSRLLGGATSSGIPIKKKAGKKLWKALTW